MIIPLDAEFLKLLHKIVLENDPQATPGYMQESMINGSMQRALTKIYGYEPFVTVIDKAAALMYSINIFHPFTDGNKRTSLLAAYFFLLFNGYHLMITEDAVTLTLKIARREIRDEKIIANWLKQHCRKNLILIFYRRFIFPRVYKYKPFIAALAVSLLEITRKIWPRA